MFEISNLILVHIWRHWDLKEELCSECKPQWLQLSTSQRRECRHDYEFEQEW